MTACVCLTILSVFLLANDKRHLRSLLAYYNVAHWMPSQANVKKERAPPTTPRKKTSAAIVTIPVRLLSSPNVSTLSAFVRKLRVSGPELCRALSRVEGFPEGGSWMVDPFDHQRFECQLLSDSGVSEADPVSSVFIDIKGDPDGAVKSVRIKIKTASATLSPAIVGALTESYRILIEQTRWTDFEAASPFLASPKPFNMDAFGANVSLQQERFDPESFNLFVKETESSAEQKRTRHFFDQPVLQRP